MNPFLRSPSLDPDPNALTVRSLPPVYPLGARVAYPEIECLGPDTYDLRAVRQRFHPRQARPDGVTGTEIYAYLQAYGLDHCLGVSDLQAIQRCGVEAFRECFAGRWVFGWRSPVRWHFDAMFVPYLCEHDGNVVLLWRAMTKKWNDKGPALRFPLMRQRPSILTSHG